MRISDWSSDVCSSDLKEDVRVWHPGQEWIWESGIGVFDPGINALSVLTKLIGDTVLLDTAALRFPSNRAAPIAADLTLSAGTIQIEVAFDFDQRGQNGRATCRESVRQ